jgi:RNA polymerase sigma factor (sigma-70 family)
VVRASPPERKPESNKRSSRAAFKSLENAMLRPAEDDRDSKIAATQQALLSLSAEQREIFLLRQNHGLDYEEIARIRRCPLDAVKQQMRMALQRLRQAVANI